MLHELIGDDKLFRLVVKVDIDVVWLFIDNIEFVDKLLKLAFVPLIFKYE